MLRVLTAAAIFVAAMIIVGWNGAADPSPVRSMAAPAAAVQTGYLTHRRLAPGAACPVTHPNGSGPYPAELSDSQGLPLRTWFGHGKSWVLPPRSATAVRLTNGTVTATIPWFVAGPGVFRIVGKRLDGSPGGFRAAIADRTPSPDGQVVPTRITVSSPGCWDIAGIVGANSVEWVYQPRTHE